MPRPIIDLNIKIVANRTKIWRVYPGTKRNLSRAFAAKDCVFLELPGASLDALDIRSRSRIAPKLAMGRAIADWHLARPSDRKSYPSKDAEDYLDGLNMRSIGAAYRNFERMYRQAKVGDLVVVTEDNGFESTIMIGEFAREFHVSDVLKIRNFGNEEIPYRAVRWLTPEYPRRKLSPELSSELGGRRAIKPVDVQSFGNELFRIAYDNFISGDDAQYEFRGEKYRSDPKSTVPGINVISFAVAVANAAIAGDLQIIRNGSFNDLVNSEYSTRELENFEISFASPGGYRIWSKEVRTVLLAVAVLALAACDLSKDEAAQAEVINSGDAANSVDPEEVNRLYGDILSNIRHGDKLEKLRQEYERAQRGVGLSSKARVKRRVRNVEHE